jgi:hypothetical protein
MVPSVRSKPSPRTGSNSRQKSNNTDSEETIPENDRGLMSVVGILVILFVVLPVIVEIFLNLIYLFFIKLLRKLGLMAPAPEAWMLKDPVDVIGKENAMWLDQYAREDGERKNKDERKR